MHKFYVNGQRIEKIECDTIASDQIAFVILHFKFSKSWEGFHKVVQFTQEEYTYNLVLGTDGESCRLPSELIPGTVRMSVFGYNSDNTQALRATTVPVTLHIRPSGFIGDDPPIPPTPDLYAQLLKKIDDKLAAIDGINGVNGKDGKDGIDGKDGANGLSAYELAVQKGYSGTLDEWLLSLKGADGKDGINGIDGVNGKDGKDGVDGKDGANGLSAYELTVQKGYSGTLDEWLLSLKGADGKDGTNGRDGVNGKDGINGKDGQDGKNGADGLSAYELTVQKGYSGTLDEWLLSLKGADGKDGTNGRDGVNGTDGKDGINGRDGINGKDGQDGKSGADGFSAYELAVQKGYSGTLDAWLLSLKGADGKDGTNGRDGVDGADGKDGVNGTDGKDGINGRDGVDGKNGLSAYELAVQKGYSGTLDAWLLSLKGADGKDGTNGINGVNGKDGINGTDGINGRDGQDGKNGADGLSAYELAVQKGFSGTLDEWLLSLKGADGNSNGASYDYVNGRIDDIQNLNQKRLAELSEAFHNRMVEIETRMSLLETELLSKSGSINEKALFTNTVDVWDVFDTTIEVLFDNKTYSLISFTERYPDFCSENTDHMLNYNYSVFGWGVSVMTAYALEVSINSRSKILMEYKAGSRQSSCFYLVSPEGRGSNTPIADFLFDRIKAGNCITIPFEWLPSENFISTVTYCTDVPDGKYYVAWTGISDNTHPLIKTIKVLGG